MIYISSIEQVVTIDVESANDMFVDRVDKIHPDPRVKQGIGKRR
jgi:hypothetical protein